MREIIRGGTYRDVTDGTLVRVIDTYTDHETNQTIISCRLLSQSGHGEDRQLTEAAFHEQFSLVV